MITLIAVVKNSADVIESMIRGNALWADNFVVLDNGSTDRTVEILLALKKEGFSIDLLKDDQTAHYQKEKMKRLIAYVCEKYNSELIVPIDDDEILCTNKEELAPGDIKEALESLDRHSLYYVSWRNYIPTDQDPAEEICVPARQHFCFDDEPEMTKKVMIPREVLTDDFRLADGNHYADGSGIRSRVHLSDLRLAHYPVRSSRQIASKALVGWMNTLIMPERVQGQSYHWERIYKTVRDGGLPGLELMQAMCTLYREHPNDDEHLNVVYRPIRLPEEALQIKYTMAEEVNYLRNLCLHMEKIAAGYAEMKRGRKEE